MRRAAKVDAPQEAIVSALRAAGAKVQSLAALGKGVPDLLVKYHDEMALLEVKDGNKPPSKRQLTPDQVEWIKAWGGGVHVVLNPDEALRAIGAIA